MKVLFTIPHYYRPTAQAADGCQHGSVGSDPEPRAAALAECVAALRRLYAPRARLLDHAGRAAWPVEASRPAHIDVIICTTGEDHLLGRLALPPRWWTRHAGDAPPALLGYECHTVLRDHLGRYDYYCYLEDDIIATDPWLFRKLAWFGRQFGDVRLLLPNRFEAGRHPLVDKLYVDGPLPPQSTAAFQDTALDPELAADVLGVPGVFRRPANPHAGCFFLSAAQMGHWARQLYFLDRSADFIGTLESAATLGIMRTFQVYKPGPENADFREVRHHSTAYLGMIPGPDG
jgi:hypothetical protein